MIDKIKIAWEKRSRHYGQKLEGVLPKSFPFVLNEYLDRWMYQQIKLKITSLMQSRLKSQKLTVLDLGCGYGRLSAPVLKDFPNARIFGIDISQNYVNLYNKNLNPRGKAVVGDIRQLPYKNNFFDVVFMVTTLMYVVNKEDQRKVMQEIFRVLKPDGGLVVIERNPIGHRIITGGGLANLIRGKKFQEIESVSFKRETIESLVKESGGKITKLSGLTIWTLFFPFAFLLARFNRAVLGRILDTVWSIDDKFNSLLTLSLYISYSGKK